MLKKIEASAEETTEPTAASAPRAAPAPRLTVEQWAEQKGFSPERLPAAVAPAGNIPLGSPMNPKFWMFAGARALSRWPQGAEVTEAEFDAAIETATNGISR